MTTTPTAHLVPYELINKILLLRPIHPAAEAIKYSMYKVWSNSDQENKIFQVIGNHFAVCISGNSYISNGEVCILDEDAKCNLPFARSGMEQVELVNESYDKAPWFNM